METGILIENVIVIRSVISLLTAVTVFVFMIKTVHAATEYHCIVDVRITVSGCMNEIHMKNVCQSQKG